MMPWACPTNIKPRFGTDPDMALDWLLDEIVIRREIFNIYYFLIFLLSIISLLLARKVGLWRFSLGLYLISAAFCTVWETALFLVGSRHYHFFAPAEMLYHGLTEAGPGLIITVILVWKLGLIDLDKWMDPGFGGEK